MWDLYSACYEATSPEVFQQDLRAKDTVLLLYCEGQLAGFTTLEVYRSGEIQVVYSGDTVVERSHWGQQALALDWLRLVGGYKRENPEVPLYWLLLVKGHRTYRYLPVFGHSFWPHWQHDRPDLKALADRLAGERFPDYNRATGVVEFPSSRGHLKPGLAHPDARELQRPEVEFFLRRNPGFVRGHEMVCLCELQESNLKPLARRVFLERPCISP